MTEQPASGADLARRAFQALALLRLNAALATASAF